MSPIKPFKYKILKQCIGEQHSLAGGKTIVKKYRGVTEKRRLCQCGITWTINLDYETGIK